MNFVLQIMLLVAAISSCTSGEEFVSVSSTVSSFTTWTPSSVETVTTSAVLTAVSLNSTGYVNSTVRSTTAGSSSVSPTRPSPITKELPIGVLLPREDKTSKECLRTIVSMALSDINGRFGGLSTLTGHYNYTAYFAEAGDTDIDVVVAMYEELLTKLPMKWYIMGPVHPQQNDYAMDFSTAYATQLMTISERDDPVIIYALARSLTPSVTYHFDASLHLLDWFNWTKVAIIYDFAESRYRKNAGNLQTMIERKKNVELQAFIGFWSKQATNTVADKVERLRGAGSRIVLGLFSIYGAREVFCQAFRRNMYRPKVVWILYEVLPPDWASDKYNLNANGSQRIREISCSEEELLIAADGYIAVVKQGLRKDSTVTISGMTAADYVARLEERGLRDCNEHLAYAYDAAWLFHETAKIAEYAINVPLPLRFNNPYNNQFFTTKQLNDVTKLQKFEGLTGPVEFEDSWVNYVSRLGIHAIWQFRKNDRREVFVASYFAREQKIEVFPEQERLMFIGGTVTPDRARIEISLVPFATPLLGILWAVALLGIVLVFVLLVFNLMYISESSVNRTSWTLNSLILVGSLGTYSAVLVYGLDSRFVSEEGAPIACYAFIGLLSFGFTLTFGTLFSKIWQMYKMYMTPEVKVTKDKLEIKNVSDWLVGGLIALFLIVDAVILICLRYVSPLKYEFRNVSSSEIDLFDDLVEIKQVVGCVCDRDTEFTITIYCYKGLLLVFGLFLAWQTRNAHINVKNESKYIAVAIYNVVAVSMIGVICAAVLKNTTRFEAAYGIIAVCICICTTTTLLVIFVPKILFVLKHQFAEGANGRENYSRKLSAVIARKDGEHRHDSSRTTTTTAEGSVSDDNRKLSGNSRYDRFSSGIYTSGVFVGGKIDEDLSL